MTDAPLDTRMPDDRFETSSIFTTESGGGRVFTSLSRPRLSFEETWTRDGGVTRVWMADGEPVPSLEEAETRLAAAPILTADEAAMLARIGDDWTDDGGLVGPMDGVVLEWDTPAGRNRLALNGLKAKGLTEDGREGTRLRREGRSPPPVPTVTETRRVAIPARILDVGSALRLVPVFAWEASANEPPGYPQIDRFIDFGAISDDAMLRTLVTAVIADLGSGAKTMGRLSGGFLLMEGSRVLIRPTCSLGQFSDLHSWQAAADGVPDEPDIQLLDPETGWTRLWIGAWMIMLPRETTVWLCEGMKWGPHIEPNPHFPVWNVSKDALAGAVADAAAVLGVVAERLRRSLAGLVPDAELVPLVAWLLHGTGSYHDMADEAGSAADT